MFRTFAFSVGCVLLLSAVLPAETNTPIPAGKSVVVQIGDIKVTGVLKDTTKPNWISVLESGQTQPTYVPLANLSFIRQAPAGVRSAVVPKSARAGVTPPAATAITGHFIHGMPRPTGTQHRFRPPGFSFEVAGITVLRRQGFTLGHYDKFKVPAWVAMRWTRADLQRSKDAGHISRGRFKFDSDLPSYARAGKDYEFSRFKFERGHQARNLDLRAWGKPGVREGMRMSNIVPQKLHHNHVVWGKLEDAHRGIVNDSSVQIPTIWIISGPVFRNGQAMLKVGNEVGVPHATYKVIAWLSANNQLQARGYIIPQDAPKTGKPTEYLKSIDEVEQATGLDFFHELSDNIEDALESRLHTRMWRE